ncbi:hypothetical protein [Tamlana sp. I1]|uniref:hypothetical protein n=1 Tax=Tamlana sp. I1 TaxID=2762061 RepID=UPI0018904469|nr:hypothetical protein [Tamlana sp. I1]
MKLTKTIFTLLILSILATSCNRYLEDLDEGDLVTETEEEEEIEYKWWILTHRSYAKPGIYLYNETTSTIELKLDLPKGLESPHALAFDGESLWVGGVGEDESIYQLNPENGAIISEIPNIKTEGIAVLDEFIYYSDYKNIKKIDKNGVLIETIATKNSSYNIPDIAIDDTNLYYLRYSENEPVVKLRLSSREENKIALSESTGTYCLTVAKNEIITINPFNEIVHFNLRTGEFILNSPTIMEGWATAIAPYEEKVEL